MFFGYRLRPLYVACWATTQVLSLGACTAKEAHDLPFKVSFACEADRELADRLTLRVVRDGCDGDAVVYEATLTRGQQAPAATGLKPGTYGLEASAFKDGVPLASGCVEASLPQAGDIDGPAIELRSPRCNAANDEDAGPADDDAGMDGGALACSSDCNDPFPCTDDRCLNGECVHEPFTGARECDSIDCTQDDHCEMGTCLPGEPNNGACADDGDPCTAETCEPDVGCNRDNAQGTSCDDQIDCTDQDVCLGGLCRGTDTCASSGVCSAATGMCTTCTGPVDCDDRDPCTTDTCSEGACQYVNNTGSCDDGKSCTDNDLCSNRVCAGTSTCPSDATCGGSTCRCDEPNETLCSDTCVDLLATSNHCGQCGRVCTDGGTCENGACKPTGASTCTAYRFGGHDYLVCPDALSWQSARDRCRGHRYGLAIIDSQAENDFLHMRPPSAERWIGANDRGANGRNCRLAAEEGTWYWADPNNTGASGDNFRALCAFASTTASSCAATNGAYVNWSSGRPNNLECTCPRFGDCSEGEDCGLITTDGTWNDVVCDRSFGFICETP